MTNKSLFKQVAHNKWQKFVHSDVRQLTTKKIIATILSIFFAFALAIIIACTVCNQWAKIGAILEAVFTSGFTDATFMDALFSNMSIMIVGGLAFIFAYKAGLFNIGISGQLVAGATCATLICHLGSVGYISTQFVIVIVSMLVSALVAGLTGALKAFLKVNEVVSSIMFNWIIYFVSILILANAPIAHDASNLNTIAPPDTVLLRYEGQSWLPLLICAAIAVVFVAVILNLTVFGKKQKVTGLSNTGALAAGYNVKANMITSMAISGALSGLLGVMLYCGFSPNMPINASAMSIPQEGFNGISVGLISMCNPFAAMPVSLFFSMVKTSVSNLQLLGIDNHIGDVVFGIVVYGAAAIALFMNLKPYWITLGIFKGKNYSKIQHERNMSNIELLSLSSDQCSVLKKYFVYYKLKKSVPDSVKFSFATKIKLQIHNLRYHLMILRSKFRVWKNKKSDLLTGKKYYKQEMAHILVNRKNHQLYVDLDHKHKFGGWYIKVTGSTSLNKIKDIVLKATKHNATETLVEQLMKQRQNLINKPFNDHEIRMVAWLAYLQNLRCGLSYRNYVTQQNKLIYFTWLQTKQQADFVGLNEIKTKKQYLLAHTAYYIAYEKTFAMVKKHYDSKIKAYPKGKQLDIADIKLDNAELSKIYMQNLKNEIKIVNKKGWSGQHLSQHQLEKLQQKQKWKLLEKINRKINKELKG